jgi:hypothetical protein
MLDNQMTVLRGLVVASVLAAASLASALPVELKDSNGTRYNINTAVNPLITNSFASGALTDATYLKPVTVTSYYLDFTPFGWFFTTETTQRQVDIPLTNAFAGFNGLLITSVQGITLPAPLVYNPGQGATEDCPQNGKNRELTFAPQTFPGLPIQVTRKVFVPDNAEYLRWLNIVTNTGSVAGQVGITLQGLLGATTSTKIGTTSSGDASVSAADLWFTAGQSVPAGTQSTHPAVGFVVQGLGASAPAVAEGVNSLGQAIVTFAPTIPAGGTAIIMTFTTVQGNLKNAKNTAENVVALPSKSLKCMSEVELSQVVNFPKITPPELKNSTIKLNFKKTGQDTVQWKGKITIGEGINLNGLPVTVDVAGVVTSFILNKNGVGNNGGGNKFNLDASLKNGVTKQGTVNLTINLKGDYQSALAFYGLTNTTVSNLAVSVPLTFTAGPGQYFADQGYSYKATAGKSGTAKGS